MQLIPGKKDLKASGKHIFRLLFQGKGFIFMKI